MEGQGQQGSVPPLSLCRDVLLPHSSDSYTRLHRTGSSPLHLRRSWRKHPGVVDRRLSSLGWHRNEAVLQRCSSLVQSSSRSLFVIFPLSLFLLAHLSFLSSAMRSFNAGPPGGRHLSPSKIRLSDLQGGPYGPGASSVRTSLSTGGSSAQTQQAWDDLIEFHVFHAERGDAEYMFRLGRLYYQGFGAGGLGGVRNLPRGRLSVAVNGGVGAAKVPGVNDGLWDGGRDFHRASRWFLKLAKLYWPGGAEAREATWNPAWGAYGAAAKAGSAVKQGEAPRLGYYDAKKDRKNEKLDEHSAMVAGLAAGYLGKMYLRGEGVGGNYAKAFLWFSRGRIQVRPFLSSLASLPRRRIDDGFLHIKGDRESNNGLGIMYRDGLGVERDIKKAIAFFHAAAQQDHAEAQVNLGKYHFGTPLSSLFLPLHPLTETLSQLLGTFPPPPPTSSMRSAPTTVVLPTSSNPTSTSPSSPSAPPRRRRVE